MESSFRKEKKKPTHNDSDDINGRGQNNSMQENDREETTSTGKSGYVNEVPIVMNLYVGRD